MLVIRRLPKITCSASEICKIPSLFIPRGNRLIFHLDTGDIQYVVLGAGDALDLGDQVILVPLQALQLNAEGDAFTINVDVETLNNAPSFDPDRLPDTIEENWDADLQDYWQDFVNQDQ